MLNTFFSHEADVGESDLFEQMVVETIQVVGVDLTYIQRIEENINALSEAKYQKLKASFIIETEILEVQQFSGDTDVFSAMGYIPQDTAIFRMAQSRFKHEGLPFKIVEPKTGDILHMPLSNTLWEIRRVAVDDTYFLGNKRYCWFLHCSLYQPNHETTDIDTQDYIFQGDLSDLLQTGEKEVLSQGMDEIILDGTDFDASNPFGENE